MAALVPELPEAGAVVSMVLIIYFCFWFRGLDWPTAPVIANAVSDHREVVSECSELLSEDSEVLINAGLMQVGWSIISPLRQTGKTAIGNGL